MRIGKLYIAAAVFLAAAVSVTCVTAGQAAAVLYRKEPLVFDNFNTDSTLTLTKCQRDAEGMISVPEKINSRAVTAVAPQAFFSCYSVTGIALPDSITTIGMSAFSHCYTLEHIYIPGHIEEIEGSAFSYCSALKEMRLPDGLIGINGSLFYGCTSLESVTIPSTVTYIESSAFTGCSALAEIVFEGTPEQWQEISVGIPNDELGNAVIKYNNRLRTNAGGSRNTGSSNTGSSRSTRRRRKLRRCGKLIRRRDSAAVYSQSGEIPPL